LVSGPERKEDSTVHSNVDPPFNGQGAFRNATYNWVFCSKPGVTERV
jgi:hypothetical protein